IGRSGSVAWPPRLPDLTPVNFFDLQHLKARIRDAVAMVTPNILDHPNICRATKGAHVEIY
ncbi:hypothetical protein B7P43_G13745, partial [Cryptotermes secundus]